jgi:hypothetical protein
VIIFLLWLIAGALIYPIVFDTKGTPGFWADLFSSRRRRKQREAIAKWRELHPPLPPWTPAADTTPGVPFTDLYNLEDGNLVLRHDAANVLAAQRIRSNKEKLWLG